MAADRKNFWMLAAAAAALVAPAQAQQAAKPQEEEIVVTATKREARLQDVPVAVTPITAAMIENSGIRDVQDLTSVAPALQFNVSENETSATARLRGIGTQGSNPGLESAVGIFIDGVYRARNGVALGDLGEISQVEVLRGPQGTLFGRNTSAGLITIQSRGPQMDSFGGGIEGTYGAFDERRVSGYITGPIIADKMGFRLFAASAKRDGFIDVINAAGARSKVNDRNMWTVRGQIEWEPSDTFSLRLIADTSKRDETCCASKIYNPALLNGQPALRATNWSRNPATGAILQPSGVAQDPFQPNVAGVSSAGQANVVAALGGFGPTGLAALGNGDISDRFAFANRSYAQGLTDGGVSLQADWDIGEFAKLTYVAAYRDWVYDQAQDADFSAADLWYRPDNGLSGFDFKVITHEARLAGNAANVDWMVGTFVSNEELGRRDNLTNGAQFGTYFAALSPLYIPLAAPGTGVNNTFIQDRYKQKSNGWSIFTHNIWSIDDKTDLTIGARYTNEKKTLGAQFFTQVKNNNALMLQGLTGVVGAGTAGALNSAGLVNCNGGLGTGALAAANAALIGARGVYCVPTLRSELDTVGFNQSRTDKEWSGVVSARRTFNEALSGYVSVSRGYKGGGFNLDRNFAWTVTGGAPNTSFAAELVDAYELGLKGRFFGGDLLLNTATYYNEYTDYQLNTFNGVSFQVSSIPKVTSAGAEIDAIWSTPIDGLSMQGGVAYVEAQYAEDSGWVDQSLNPLNPSAAPVNFRLPGQRLTTAPLWTLTNAMTYERPIGGNLVGLGYVDFRYTSNQVTGSDLEDTKRQPGYWLVNARLGLKTEDERFGVELWGRNILDQDFHQIAFNVPLQGNARGAFLGDPRTFGVTLKAGF
jgi:iron complex outermembrane recepter protein